MPSLSLFVAHFLSLSILYSSLTIESRDFCYFRVALYVRMCTYLCTKVQYKHLQREVMQIRSVGVSLVRCQGGCLSIVHWIGPRHTTKEKNGEEG